MKAQCWMRLYQQIADRIRQLIIDERYGAGQRLPSERDLALQLGVSRPSIREALIALEIEGAVEIRVGSGVYVSAESPSSSSLTRSMGDSAFDIMQARIVIEGSVAQMASGTLSGEAILRLEQILVEMERVIAEGSNPVQQDRAFHLAIAAASGNTVLERVVTDLFDQRHSPISAKLQDHFGTQQAWLMALEEHRMILKCLANRDGPLAEASMRMHLEASRRRWTD